jgi:hypothetical protein
MVTEFFNDPRPVTRLGTRMVEPTLQIPRNLHDAAALALFEAGPEIGLLAIYDSNLTIRAWQPAFEWFWRTLARFGATPTCVRFSRPSRPARGPAT